jgi:CRISPR-associated protein (TIGR02584 family)
MNAIGATDILLAVLGMSPAVLTETIWVLAHESPPVIPHQVLVLATRPAKDRLVQVLFQEQGWDRLRSALERKGLPVSGRLCFGRAAEHVRLFPKGDGSGDLEDLATAADGEAAADFIMRALRGLTEDASTRVIASIAGGRKTMSALLTSCMVLLGRSRDRLCHVLVSPPYDSPGLQPAFLFPEADVVHRLPETGRPYASEEATIELCDLPFVRVRVWYEREYRHVPPSYMQLVRHVQGLTPESVYYPCLEIDYQNGTVAVDQKPVPVSRAEFALLWFVGQRIQANRPWRRWAEIGSDLERLRGSKLSRQDPEWQWEFGDRDRFDREQGTRKLASSLRDKLAAAVEERGWIETLLPNLRRPSPLLFPAHRIVIRGR